MNPKVYPLALAALLCAASVPAQPPATANPKGQSTVTPNKPVTAFFYQQPEVLDRDKHKALRVKPGTTLFAKANQAVPLVAAEFPSASLEYPIVFGKGSDDQWLALAVTGLKSGTNAFVDSKGAWQARYVPLSVRRYPFILAEGANAQLSLAIDMAAPNVGKEGEPVFDAQGEPTEFVKKLMPLLAEFQQQAKFTSALIKKLDEAGLLVRQNLQVAEGEQRKAVLEGVWIVDEAKLRQLPDETVLAWFKSGELALVHAQMLSLRNLAPLLDRSLPPASKPRSPSNKKRDPS